MFFVVQNIENFVDFSFTVLAVNVLLFYLLFAFWIEAGVERLHSKNCTLLRFTSAASQIINPLASKRGRKSRFHRQRNPKALVCPAEFIMRTLLDIPLPFTLCYNVKR